MSLRILLDFFQLGHIIDVAGDNQSQQQDFSDTEMTNCIIFYACHLRTGLFTPKQYGSEGMCRIINHYL